MARYAELHSHTNYSFLDGASHPHDLVAVAAELEYEALAVTDHDGFRGAAKAHLAARDIGLPIVYGTEVGMSRESQVPPPGGWGTRRSAATTQGGFQSVPHPPHFVGGT